MRALSAILLLLGGLSEALPQPGPDGGLSLARPEVVWIPGGWFFRGSDRDDVDYALWLCLEDWRGLAPEACPEELFIEEAPQQRVWISAFGMDRTEVTHAAWRRCVVANRCPPPRVSDADERLAAADYPVVGVTWAEAAGYCEFAGGRLPTESEWERGARGIDRRRFPWGRHYNPALANHGRAPRRTDTADGYGFAAPVGSYPAAASPFGLVDMAGNAWEWTADRWAPDAYLDGDRVDPRGPATGGERIVRGGSWRFPAYALRVTNRARLGEGDSWPDVGFRCAYDTTGR